MLFQLYEIFLVVCGKFDSKTAHAACPFEKRFPAVAGMSATRKIEPQEGKLPMEF
jgi:hypothetical protein